LNSLGCDSIATLVLTIKNTPPKPVIAASGPLSICGSGSVTLNAIDSINGKTTRFVSNIVGFSSQYGNYLGGYSAIDLIGAPNVYPVYADNGNAWAPAGADNQREYLDLGFDKPAPVSYVDVYETFNPGTIDTVYVKNPNTGNFDVVYTNTAAATAPVADILHITFPTTTYNVSEIRIAINAPVIPSTWVEIDAVAIGTGSIYSPSFKWSDAAADTSSSITVTNAGKYAVTATLNGCSLTSDSITVNKYDSVKISRQPISTPYCSAGNADYTIGATGDGLTYNWQTTGLYAPNTWYDHPSGGSWDYASTFTDTVRLNGIYTAYNQVKFRCIVSGTCNTVTSDIIIPDIVSPSYSTPDTITACDSYNWKGNTYNNTGTYYDTVGLNSKGCDSIATLVLTIKNSPPKPVIAASGPLSICGSGSVTLNAIDSLHGKTTRFVSTIVGFSSQYGNYLGGYSASDLIGAPNAYPVYGDNGNAWAPAGADNQREYLDLGFNNPAPVNYVDVYETFNPGTIDTVYVKNPNTGNFDVVYTNTAVATASVADILHITFPKTAYNVSEIRIAINAPVIPNNWVEIDAVAIGNIDSIYSPSFKWSDAAADTSSSITVTNAGKYAVTATLNGCSVTSDSTVFTIKGGTGSKTTISTCNSYLWHGTNYTTSGTYTFDTTNAAGCDSITTLNLTITTPVTPVVSIAANPSGSIVSGTSVTFTATPTNGGNAPVYQWKKNGGNVGTNSSTYSDAGILNNDVITCVITADNTCQSSATATSNSITETVTSAIANYTWTGATSTDWNLATNWSYNLLPTTGVTVTIPSAPSNQPLLSIDVSVGGIVLNGSVGINGHTFTITGAVSGTGIFKGTASSSLTVNSSSNNTISFGTTATDSLLSNLTNSGSGTLTLGTGLGITGVLSVTNGTFSTGNHLTLKSTSITNTAVVGVVSGTITGKVTVERYIPQGNRAFRDLGAEVANSGAILNNWQEGGNSPAGYGIYITGVKGTAPGGVDATTGLDKTQTGSPSLYIYGSGSWPSVTNTRTNSLDPFMGYRASIRGDRTYNIYAPDPGTMVNATTLRSTGNLVTGNVVYNTTNVTSSVYTSTAAKLISGLDNYSFVANPYACPIDWEAVYANGGTTNLTASYWYFDPTFMSNGYATYVTYNAVSHVNSNHPTSKLDRYIQPGMAFFVQNSNSSNPTLSITESNKAPNSTKTAVYGANVTPNYLQVSLWKNISGVKTNIDGAVAVFNTSFTKVISDKDSKKLLNGGENLFITQANTDLSIAGLPMPVVNDEIVLNLNQVVAGTNYQLELDASQYTNAGVEAFIKDKLLNTVVPASEGISFTPTKDVSTYEGRFSIVFKATDVIATGNLKQIAVYPNPVTGNLFNIQMGSLDKGTYKVIVVNALGKEVLNTTIQHAAGASVETIHTSTLIPGLYTVTIQGKTTVCHTEMIIGK